MHTSEPTALAIHQGLNGSNLTSHKTNPHSDICNVRHRFLAWNRGINMVPIEVLLLVALLPFRSCLTGTYGLFGLPTGTYGLFGLLTSVVSSTRVGPLKQCESDPL